MQATSKDFGKCDHCGKEEFESAAHFRNHPAWDGCGNKKINPTRVRQIGRYLSKSNTVGRKSSR